MVLSESSDLNLLDSSVGHGEKYDADLELPWVRLNPVREWFLSSDELDVKGVRFFYRRWRSEADYLKLRVRVELRDRFGDKRIAFKCAKRGNDVYLSRVKDSFSVLKRLFVEKDMEFFKLSDKERKTRVLFATLTYDVKRKRVQDAWVGIGREFHNWMRGLRKKFGHIRVLRTWESFENGYPHVHALLYFADREFRVWPDMREPDGELVFRIDEKREFEGWHSFVDIRAARTLSAVIRYIQKRVMFGTDRNGDEERGDLTMALCWLFRKRSFSLSRELARGLADLIRDMRNWAHQLTVDGRILKVWEPVGRPGPLEGANPCVWFYELDRDLKPVDAERVEVSSREP